MRSKASGGTPANLPTAESGSGPHVPTVRIATPATTDYFRTFRSFAPVAALGGTASVGFAFTRFTHAPDAFRTPGFADHLVTYYLGEPMRFTQERAGRRRSERIGRGCMTFTPAGQGGYWAADGPVDVLQFSFAPGYLDGVAAAASGSSPHPVGLDNHLGLYDPRLDHAAGLVLAELADPGGASGVYLDSLALVVATRVLAAFGPGPAGDDRPGRLDPARVKRVIDYIEAHLADPLTLTDLARVACLSPYHFARQFARTTGAAPHRYLVARRIERAKALLLAEPSYPLAAVAADVGFADQSHLTRHFSRAVGISPRRFREAARR